uniref:Uncharacterized protein n=1 Tax=Anguilla anguilla TaxID=7936 RepID=A0A0E9TKQ4_ANGAN
MGLTSVRYGSQSLLGSVNARVSPFNCLSSLDLT